MHHLPTHPPPAACARPATAFAPQHSLRVRLASAIRAPVARLSSGRVALPTRRLVPSDHIHSLTHLVLASVSSRGVLHVTVRPRPQPIPGSFLTPFQGWCLQALLHGGCTGGLPHLCTPHATRTTAALEKPKPQICIALCGAQGVSRGARLRVAGGVKDIPTVRAGTQAGAGGGAHQQRGLGAMV